MSGSAAAIGFQLRKAGLPVLVLASVAPVPTPNAPVSVSSARGRGASRTFERSERHADPYSAIELKQMLELARIFLGEFVN